MIFETRIFIPFERKTSDLVLSEKITYSSFGLIFLCFIILFIFHKFSSPELINFLSTTIITLVFIAIFLRGFLRMFEYENLNGTFDGHFQLDSENIKMNNRIFELSTISALKIEILRDSGQITQNQAPLSIKEFQTGYHLNLKMNLLKFNFFFYHKNILMISMKL